MKYRNVIKKFGPAAIGSALLVPMGSVLAQSSAIAAGATAALGDTETDVTSVAVVVAGIVALIVAATLIFGMLKKG